MPFTGSDILKIILAVILPPLGVFLERGCGADLIINIVLTCLGYIPGVSHAIPKALGNMMAASELKCVLTLGDG
ncbi:plasma membrane proteolipid Pmp3 [Friedmanniomyces endolithicus]|uniref:Plasma membrane proteolipid Pmp3 n=1 Tax=Friedmanniomyces endolithicus TaxID=329885 RepID=A0AAN6KH50_9PEZI|nr:plasma membrane proteolipid Pmp3 [Friedmanniomyces endolithicus]KAK0778700.1 plasma membrane proteolipid Pmp3 [Friedmanniomyces endolithicus]KAK0785876.1 plasma membrane proteolipid Pmp3 [Friedmanniomyces endolithicus]KAK0791529.1 plasma membrane proteolipid Pmp3 [Friedmanniomyces endolithicus]KAK0839045.1 plasma membrane proteolipid Pmp3 [Friedmanniomyces endolithicus]